MASVRSRISLFERGSSTDNGVTVRRGSISNTTQKYGKSLSPPHSQVSSVLPSSAAAAAAATATADDPAASSPTNAVIPDVLPGKEETAVTASPENVPAPEKSTDHAPPSFTPDEDGGTTGTIFSEIAPAPKITTTTKRECAPPNHGTEPTNPDEATKQPTKRVVKRRKPREDLKEALSQSAPDFVFDPDSEDSIDDNSVNSWSQALRPVSPGAFFQIGSEASSGKGSVAGSGAPNKAGHGKTPSATRKIQIKASELGIRLDDNTTSEELAEAVRRWKADYQNESENSNGVNGNAEGAQKATVRRKKKDVSPPGIYKTDTAENQNGDASGHSRKAVTKVIVHRRKSATQGQSDDTSVRRRASISNTPGGSSEPIRTIIVPQKDGSYRRGRSKSPGGMRLSHQQTPQSQQVRARSLSAVKTRENRTTTTGVEAPAGESVSHMVDTGDNNDRAPQQPTRKEHSTRTQRSQQPQPQSQPARQVVRKVVSAGQARKVAGASASPERERNRTPTRRVIQHGIATPPKGREISKSPIRDGDLRPVPWRAEDSHLHKNNSNSNNNRGGGTLRSSFDENDEIQKRLRQAGITEDQYKAILAMGLTIQLANRNFSTTA